MPQEKTQDGAQGEPQVRSSAVLWLDNYDPNIPWAKHTVEVRLVQWQYGISVTTTVNGNTRGESIIRCAIESVCEKLEEEGCEMTAPDGDTLGFDADETTSDEYEAMVVGARIISHEKQ